MQVAVGYPGLAVLERGDRDEARTAEPPALFSQTTRGLTDTAALDPANLHLDGLRSVREIDKIVRPGANRKDSAQAPSL